MNILVTGCAGFVGSNLCRYLKVSLPNCCVTGIDNLSRRGSESNLNILQSLGVKFIHGDVRCASDFVTVGPADYVIHASADPSVMSGVDGDGARKLVEQNLVGTTNLLEYCRLCSAGLIFLSSSRVYSIAELRKIALVDGGQRFNYAEPTTTSGLTSKGINESFSTRSPISLYGATKLASEILAMEYSCAYGIPVWINRCGLLGGVGQFGHSTQGVVSYWIKNIVGRSKLTYTGQGGNGFQVRDLMHPDDLGALICKQLSRTQYGYSVYNVSGGMPSSFSLCELTDFCRDFGMDPVIESQALDRPNDAPHIVLDSTIVRQTYDWSPAIGRDVIFADLIKHELALHRNG